jgi:hypothetical protein
MRDEYLERLISKYEKRLRDRQNTVTEYEQSRNAELINCVRVFKGEVKQYEYILKGLCSLRLRKDNLKE